MKIFADYHTHSTYSRPYHARHSIFTMAKTAQRLGLKQLAITDHGPKHILFGIRPKNLIKARQKVNEYNSLHPEFKLLLGVEANLIGADGQIDLTDEQIDKLDLLIVGYHKGTKTNFIKYFGNKNRETPEQIQKNTQAYINCLKRYKVSIISHLNEYIKVDVDAVSKVAKQQGTIIELNNKHLKFNDQEIKALIDSGVNFVLSSDAHKKQSIAKVDKAMELVKKYNISPERIVNLQK